MLAEDWNLSYFAGYRILFLFVVCLTTLFAAQVIQGIPGGKVSILGGHSIGHSKQESVYVHVSNSKRLPIYSYFTVQFQNCLQERNITYCF
jgi:hypothetical protein